MFVVIADDLVKQGRECVEALVATCVHTDTRVSPLAAGEDALLEGEAILVFLIFAGVPDVTRKNLREERFGSAREEREAFNFLGAL